MVSADTNVIVRLLVGDDKSQSEKAKRLFEREEIFIPTTVVLECEWILRYAYHFEPTRIAHAFQALFGLPNVTLQEQAVIADAIAWHQQGMDFADALNHENATHMVYGCCLCVQRVGGSYHFLHIERTAEIN